MSGYKTEFPDFESEIPAVFLAPPWRDVSWHNDATPSFARTCANGREIHVYVDELDPAKRWEGGPDSPRFSIQITDASGSFDADGWSSIDADDVGAALAAAKKIESRWICDTWVAKLGFGFHPDTRGSDYDPPLKPEEVAQYDADMELLMEVDDDPYDIAVKAMKAWEAQLGPDPLGDWHGRNA
jgi:hypothetical protein